MRRRLAHPGFTLLELLIVITIVAVLAGLAVPVMWTRLATTRLDSAADQLVGMLQMARIEALQRGTAVRVRWDSATKRLIAEAKPSLREQSAAGSGEGPAVGEDGFARITPIWAADVALPEDVTIQTTLLDPPGLRMLLAEYQAAQTPKAGVGGQSSIDNRFEIQTQMEDPARERVQDGGLIAVQFDPDGTPLDRQSLRIVLVQGRPDAAASSSLSSGSGAAGGDSSAEQLDPDVPQRWITVEGMTGRVYTVDPPKPIIELANKYQGKPTPDGGGS